MKLLYLNHNVVGTGTYLRAFHLARALVKRGHTATLVTTSRHGRFRVTEREQDAVRIIEAPDLWWGPARTGWDPWNTARRIGFLQDYDFDLVHAFDGRPVVSLPAWLLLRRSGLPYVMDWADWWGRGGQIQQRSGWAVRTFFGPVETWFEEAFRPAAAAHTVISQALRERAAAMGIEGGRILTLPGGCASDEIRPAPRAEARRALRLEATLPLVVHLGVLTAADADLLFAAVRLLRQALPGSTLVLVGRPGVTVPADLLADGTVRTTGYVSSAEKDLWLAAGNACVIALPDTVGNRGRWPSRINDYLSAGRATVMTDVSDAAGLVRERGLGWVTPAHPAGLADGMLQALRSADAAEEAGERARGLAEAELDWGVLAGRLEGLYLRVRQEGAEPRLRPAGAPAAGPAS